MSVALLTAATNPPAWVHHTLPLQAQFALRLKADFQVVQCDPGGTDRWERSNFWVKLRALEALLGAQTKYDRIIWIDIDVIPNLFTLDNGDIRLLTDGERLKVCVDPMKTLGKRFMTWFPFSGLPACERITHEAPYYNAGVFSISRTDAERYVACWRAHFDHKPGPFYDQDFLNYFIAAHDVPLRVMPPSMNWVTAHMNLDETLRKGKLVHFCGPQKHLIEPFAKFFK